jgi:hypothetical protein
MSAAAARVASGIFDNSLNHPGGSDKKSITDDMAAAPPRLRR